MPTHRFTISEDSNETLLAAVRRLMPGSLSWSAARKLVQGRRVAVGEVLCLDEARRLTAGETIVVSDHPAKSPPTAADVRVRYVDPDVVIVEKPSGMTTLRRKSELSRPLSKRLQQPTLDECVPLLIREHAARRNKSKRIHQRLPKLISVHRIDRDSSGLLVFARNDAAAKKIIEQFAAHDAVRRYFALVPGCVPNQTFSSQFIRDRGDGLRGSSPDPEVGQHAVTHVETLRVLGDYSELLCRLETGRTNQIRIHLAELGHPICGDIKYRGPFDAAPIADESHCPRLALHAAQLRFAHPETGELLTFESNWPADMATFISTLS